MGLRVWLVTVGEPLPIDEGCNRLLRTGVLAQYLIASGHDVTWWTSSFNHMLKMHRACKPASIKVNNQFRIILLRSVGYRKNVSFARLVDHAVLGWQFRRRAKDEPRPDIILVSLPTLELAVEACEYAKSRAVPIVVDVRDLWPEVFQDALPAFLRRAAAVLFQPYRRMARRACARATAIIGPNRHYVCWGLAHAGRTGTPADREFPFAYPGAAPVSPAIDVARAFWTDQGLSTGRDRFNVCFFGTLGRQFDLETVILAARRLETAATSIRVVICGTGDREPYYRKLAHGCRNVLFPGWVGAAEIWTLMRMSRAALAPYAATPNFVHHIPNKPIEYLSAGLPVLTPLSGALGHLLTENHCGVVYGSGDAEGLATCIRRLQDTPGELRQLAENAAALYRARFVAESVYPELVRYLESLATDPARARMIATHDCC